MEFLFAHSGLAIGLQVWQHALQAQAPVSVPALQVKQAPASSPRTPASSVKS